MIKKVERTVTETGTSINQDIELSQKGIIQFVPSLTARHFVIPCNIPNPKVFTIIPMHSNSAHSLNASSSEALPWCDLVLHKASDVNASMFASVASEVYASDVGYRLRMDTASYNLYVAAASQAATTAASNARLASNSLWHPVPGFQNNAKKYLKVGPVTQSVSASFSVTKQKFSYEVRGY